MMSVLAGAVMMSMLLSGCLSLDRNESKKSAAATTIQMEVAELVRSYRLCLEKHEDNPIKAKESCGMYKEAIRDLAPDNQKSIVAELLDLLRDKGVTKDQ